MTEEYWHRMLSQNSKLYGKNVNEIKTLLSANRGCVYETPRDEHVLLLLSGGMDSVILTDIVIKKWNCKIIFLYFKRNSKNQLYEEQAVDLFYNLYKERHPNNIIELIKLEIDIPSRINKEFIDRTRQKVMMLPLRNSNMWDHAFTQAVYLSGKYKTTLRTVIVGSVKEDETSPESGILAILAKNLQVCISLGLWYYQLLAPFIDGTLGKTYDKLDLIKYAKKHKIPIEKSRSCFGPNEQPCNECLACINRNNAYEQLKEE